MKFFFKLYENVESINGWEGKNLWEDISLVRN